MYLCLATKVYWVLGKFLVAQTLRKVLKGLKYLGEKACVDKVTSL